MRYSSTSGDALLTFITGVLLASTPTLVQAIELPPVTTGDNDAIQTALELDDAGLVTPGLIAPGAVLQTIPAPELTGPELSEQELVSVASVEPLLSQVDGQLVNEQGVDEQPGEDKLVALHIEAAAGFESDAPAEASLAEVSSSEVVSSEAERFAGVPAARDRIETGIVENISSAGFSVTDNPVADIHLAQAIPLPAGTPPLPAPLPEPDQQDQPFLPGEFDKPEIDEPRPQLPPPSDILEPTPTQTVDTPLDGPGTINVTGYVVEGSTVFDAEELAAVTQEFTGDVSFNELLQARTAVTQLYVSKGYVTSGAFIPPQTMESGIVKIQVLEGKLEGVRLTGNERLHPYYIRTRLERAGAEPLNVEKLLEGLKVLQLDPLLSSISADLQAGIQPGTSLLDVEIKEVDPFTTTVSLDNGRSPSVGSFRRKVSFNHANLLGYGDALNLAYSNTDGSNALDLGYTVPLNARNGTLRFAYGRTRSEVIEEPFSPLEIAAKSIYYEGTYRQPVYQTAAQEVALGVTFSRQESTTKLGFADIGGFPLSPGANEDGETKISALRFFQEWNKRSSRQVLAARSQLNVGTNWFESTQNSDAPDSNFISWRGQGQWVRLLAPDTLTLLRTDLQFADRNLVPLEQFGIGGQSSVRGYRQDALLTDNGLLLTAEVRLPVARIPSWDTTVQVAPFLDVGHGWNNDDATQPEEKTLVGTGLGFIWRQGNNFSARVDWGFPLVDVENEDDTWQENGIYFSVNYTPF